MGDHWKLGGIDCYFNDPLQTQTRWAFESLKLLHQSSIHLKDLELQINDTKLLKLTRERLKHIHSLVGEHQKLMAELLKPLGWQEVDARAFSSYAQQSSASCEFMEDYWYLFRDWNWGEEENQKSLECLLQQFSDEKKFKSCLVLGSGAGRLSFDLSGALEIDELFLCDINPLLQIVAEKIFSGQELTLVDFPTVPSTANDFAVKCQLKAPEKVPSKVQLLLADARSFPAELGSFELILSPWIVDVIDMQPALLIQKINSLLPMGGTWANIGPVGFNRNKLADYHSKEEFEYMVEKFGFKLEQSSYERLPYSQNPHSNQHRVERVFSFRATKVKEFAAPEFEENFVYPWLAEPQDPIEIPVQEMKLEEGHRLNGFVVSLVDGKASFEEISTKVSQHYGIPLGQSQMLTHRILANAQDSMRLNPNR